MGFHFRCTKFYLLLQFPSALLEILFLALAQPDIVDCGTSLIALIDLQKQPKSPSLVFVYGVIYYTSCPPVKELKLLYSVSSKSRKEPL